MQKSLKSAEYARLIAMLVAVREKAGIRQQPLAEKLGKPQSFIAKYEGGERRIDLIEFIAIARALDADPLNLIREFLAGEPVPNPAPKPENRPGDPALLHPYQRRFLPEHFVILWA